MTLQENKRGESREQERKRENKLPVINSKPGIYKFKQEWCKVGEREKEDKDIM